MVEYSKINTKLSNQQVNTLKSGAKRNESINLRIGAKNFNKQDLPHELYLTTRQTSKIRNAIKNSMSIDIKLSKAQIKKIAQSGVFLGRLIGPLLKIAAPLATKVLPILGLSAASSAIHAELQKKMYGSGSTTLIISNKELDDVMKIVQALEDQGILMKGVTKTIKNEIKQQKGGFLSMLMGTLGASLLGDILSKSLLKEKGIVRAGEEIKKKH